MGDISLEKLEARISDTLQKAEVTQCQKILQLTDYELLKLGNISLKDVDVIRKLAAETYLKNKPQRVSSILQNPSKKWDKLSTGCVYMNRLLRGGISRRGVTELSGESGSGKTQFCLQLTITVQLPATLGGFSAGAVYICTEDKFPSLRLQQILNKFPLTKNEDAKKLGDNIFIEHIADIDGLKQCVMSQLPNLMKNQSIGLIVIDSITAVFRAEYDYHDMIQRAKDLRTIGLQLHSLAYEFNTSVLCVNQVSSVIKTENSSSTTLVPALGLAWANLVTTRLQMIRSENDRRALHVLFAPDLAKASCPYRITGSGVCGIESQ